MKKKIFGMIAVAMLIGLQVRAQEVEVKAEKDAWIPTISLQVDYQARYMSKGKVVNPESMIFGDANLSWDFGFYAGIWVAHDWNDTNKEIGIAYEPEEIDWYIGYAYKFEEVPGINSLEIDLCYTYWDYPKRAGDVLHNRWEQNRELSLKLTTGLRFKPGIWVACDHENDKWYAKLFASHEYEIIEKLTLTNKGELYWGNGRYNGGTYPGDRQLDHYKNALSTFVWTVNLDYAITENIKFGPLMQMAWALDHDVRESWKGPNNFNSKNGCNILWGFKVAAEF